MNVTLACVIHVYIVYTSVKRVKIASAFVTRLNIVCNYDDCVTPVNTVSDYVTRLKIACLLLITGVTHVMEMNGVNHACPCQGPDIRCSIALKSYGPYVHEIEIAACNIAEVESRSYFCNSARNNLNKVPK